MIEIIANPPEAEWDVLLKRGTQATSAEKNEAVAGILAQVKVGGDSALLDFAEKFDKAKLASLAVSQQEISEAQAAVAPELKQAIAAAKANIEAFHAAQKRGDVFVETAPGVRCWQKTVPIQKVGLYIPGGSAPLFSTVLMLAVPAQIAGCREIVLCTPPNAEGGIHPAILYAAGLCGVSKIFKCGGAQAIGAMAYGTATVPKVDKIFGPGNQYVTIAKQMVSVSDTAIDMPAGPSEVLVMADDTADASFVAADLLSQAEHGNDSQAILATDSETLARAVQTEVEIQLKALPREALAASSLENSRIIVLQSTEEMIGFTNRYAPEHLIISMANPWKIADKIESAGSIFLGNYAPESAGDYASGTNHTLPTNGWAASYSGVNLDSFTKKITCQEITPEGLLNIGVTIETMAEAEQLQAHKNAVTVRLNKIRP